MPISAPTVGTRANANTGSPTSVAVDISGVPVGQVVFVVLSLGDSQASAVTPPAGWTIPSGGQGSEGTSGLASSRDVLLWHVKASGETTVTLSWPTGAKGTAQAITWPGAYPLAPVEAAAYLAHTMYREIRALRIYEGATEVQQLIVGRDLLKAHGERQR